MSYDQLVTTVALLAALSAASERLVEIIKGLSSYLSETKDTAAEEGKRKAAVQGIAIGAGIVTALLASFAVPGIVSWQKEGEAVVKILALGLLASGGSGLWNPVLEYLKAVKDIHLFKVDEKRTEKKMRDLRLQEMMNRQKRGGAAR